MAGKQPKEKQTPRRSEEEVAKLTALARSQHEKRQKEGGYFMAPYELYREHLANWIEAHGARKAHAAVVLYGYLHSYTSGEKKSDVHMWAYPTTKQITADTGIGKNTLTDVLQILIDAGLVVTNMKTWNGKDKKLYLPLYYPKHPAEGAANQEHAE
jgi:hypothetical protein